MKAEKRNIECSKIIIYLSYPIEINAYWLLGRIGFKQNLYLFVHFEKLCAQNPLLLWVC